MNDLELLKEVWMSEAVSVPFNESELVSQVRRQAKTFDGRVQRRNWLEYAAGAVAMVYLTAVAFRTDGLVRLACIVSVLAAAWVLYFIRRYGSAAPDPNPQLSLSEYRDAILKKYDRQIWLLKNVKFWYLLPLYTGMMLLYAGVIAKVAGVRGYVQWPEFVLPACATLFFGFVWWLNEGYGVRKLRREREQVRRQLDP